MPRLLISDSPTIWNLLNGVVCLFKPAGQSVFEVRKLFLGKLSQELCELDCRAPEPYVAIEGDTTKPLTVTVSPSYADNPLVVGPRYEPSDFRCNWATALGINTSGVLVLGINGGTKEAYNIHNSHPLRTYHVSGRLGEATHNLYTTGRLIEKSSYRHIHRSVLDKLLANIQASHQRTMYDLCGVDLQSEAAYELAVNGVIRPANTKLPIIYGVNCIDFNPPDFTLEIHCINEYESYLMALILSIGMKLRSCATCTQVRCVKHSFFTLNEALLKKHWTLQDVLENMRICKKLIREHRKLSAHLKVMKQTSKTVTA